MPSKTRRAQSRAPRRRARPTPTPRPAPVRENQWARLVELGDKGELWVELAGERLRARSVVALDRKTVEQAISARTPALVSLVDDAPVIVGLAREVELEVRLPKRPEHAKVDGRRVSLTADDEIELRCGKASIVLRRNGRLVIRGAYVESSSAGINRIKGGAVQIN